MYMTNDSPVLSKLFHVFDEEKKRSFWPIRLQFPIENEMLTRYIIKLRIEDGMERKLEGKEKRERVAFNRGEKGRSVEANEKGTWSVRPRGGRAIEYSTLVGRRAQEPEPALRLDPASSFPAPLIYISRFPSSGFSHFFNAREVSE